MILWSQISVLETEILKISFAFLELALFKLLMC